MGKMHELLASEGPIVANYNRDRDETLKVFERGDLFRRQTTTKTFFDDDKAHLNTSETKEITTTVKDRLAWHGQSIASLFDIVFQKDKTNQVAVGDITVGEKVIAKDVPATTLLMLETKIQDIRKVFETIPVLPPGVEWVDDPQSQLWRTKEPTVSFSTKKTARAVVLYDATKEHPAQVKEVSEDVPVARIETTTWAGLLTSAEKATLLGRLDTLLRAVKTARMRANMVEAEKGKIGDALVSFLYEGSTE